MKHSLKIIAVILAAATVFGFASLFAAADNDVVGKTGIVIAGSVNIREEPSMTASTVGGLTLGKKVDIIGVQMADGMEWYWISYNGVTGYMRSTYVDVLGTTGMVKGGSVNIRESADLTSARIGGASFGKAVDILRKVKGNDGKDWYRIYAGDIIGYMPADYVGITSLPEQSEVGADYNKIIYASGKALNVPKGYTLNVNGKRILCEKGSEEFDFNEYVGQFKKDGYFYMYIEDAEGNHVLEKSVTVKVDSGFFAIISAYFQFIFNGFKWSDQTVEIV